MKKLVVCLLASLLAAAALSDPVSDIKAGTDLAVRCTGGSFAVSGVGTFNLAPSVLVKVSKTANTLVASVPTSTLLGATGISTNLTFTGVADSTTGGINWTVTDPGLLGQTLSLTFQGTPITFTVNAAGNPTPGVSGNIYTVATHGLAPIFDPLESVYRGESFVADSSQNSQIVINGVVDGVLPASITINPNFAGLGGEKVTRFVNHVLLSTPTVVSGQSYTGTVTLESAATTATTVTISSNLGTAGAATVAAGSKTGTFTFTPNTVYVATAGFVHAIAFGTTADEPITAEPLLASVTVNNAVPIAGAPVQFTINLNAKTPPSGIVVHLESDDVNLPLPATVTVPGNVSNFTFTATPAVVSTNSSATAVTETYLIAIYAGTIVRTALYLH